MEGTNYWNRSLRRRRLLSGATAAGLGAATWALAGCGDDDDGAKTPASGGAATSFPGITPAASASAAATTAAQPRRGGTVTYYIGGEPPNLDVHKSPSAYIAGYGSGAAYSGLVKAKATGHGGALMPVGDLAESWQQPDQSTYVFKLRGNAKFHNIAPVSGRVATAQDVVYSFQRQISEKVNASLLGGIKALTAVDATTLRIELDAPNVDFLAIMTSPQTKVIAREIVEANGNLENGPVIGTGPWIWKEWKKGVSATMSRNPDYFIPTLPYADELFFPLIKDEAQIEAQFLAGKLTTVSVATGGAGIPPKRFDQLDKKKYGVFKYPNYGSVWVWFKQDFPAFKDVRVRKALSLAIDRQLIIDNVFDGLAVWDAIGSPLPGADWRLPQEELKKLLPYDPKAAKAQYDASGANIPKQTMPVFESAATLAMGQIVQANFKAIGLETEIRSIDPIALTTGLYSPSAAQYTVATANASGASTLTANLQQYLNANGSRNSMKINDPELEGLIKSQQIEFDEKKRREIVNRIERMIIDKAYFVSLGAPLFQLGYALSTHNIEQPPGAPGGHHWFSEIWFDA